jgi:hypothetical protein
VQEMSHPEIAAAAGIAEADLPVNGSYPLVQEFSHPR